MKNLKVQRFDSAHPLYSDAWIINNDKRAGVVGKFQATFGQCIDADTAKFICFTMERRDTLIPEGKYPFVWYVSPKNGRVPLLQNVPGFSWIEHHVANWPYQLEGCTAHGLAIDVKVPALISSRKALAKLFEHLNNEAGTVTYETLTLKNNKEKNEPAVSPSVH
jgi:hypothetical protein